MDKQNVLDFSLAFVSSASLLSLGEEISKAAIISFVVVITKELAMQILRKYKSKNNEGSNDNSC